MPGGYDIQDFDDAVFSEEVKQQLASQRCPGCDGALRWTVPQKEIQLGQMVTVTGACATCRQKYEMEFRL